jgi:hypothetical protein
MTDINIAEPRPTEKELPALEEPTRERLGVQ